MVLRASSIGLPACLKLAVVGRSGVIPSIVYSSREYYTVTCATVHAICVLLTQFTASLFLFSLSRPQLYLPLFRGKFSAHASDGNEMNSGAYLWCSVCVRHRHRIMQLIGSMSCLRADAERCCSLAAAVDGRLRDAMQ